jgi:hypothetical protein
MSDDEKVIFIKETISQGWDYWGNTIR